MRVLCLGDIVGGIGMKYVQQVLPKIRQEKAIDFCIANAENAAGGLGLTGNAAQQLYRCGVDCITLGNHTWSKWELTYWIDSDPKMVRPLNGGKHWPGQGFAVFDLPQGRLLVSQFIGQAFMQPCSSPFDVLQEHLPYWKEEIKPRWIMIDFHGEATAEKLTFAHYFTGSVSVVMGTHTHVQTADERILANGTGFITDLGMCGPRNGILGMKPEVAIRRMVENLPARYELADGPPMLHGAIFTLDKESSRCLHIERIVMKEDV